MKNNKIASYYTARQSGRTMTEMLSVVSIIGILTVGGIAGYSVLMERHRNNQRLQDTTIAAVAVSSQLLAGNAPSELPINRILDHEVSLATAPAIFNDYIKSADALALEDDEEPCQTPVECGVKPGDETFALQLTNVTPSVCRFFMQIAIDLGLIQGVYDSTGAELTSAEACNVYEKGSSSYHTTTSGSSSTTTSGSSGTIKAGGSSESAPSVIYLVYRSDMALTKSKEAGEIIGDQKPCGDNGEPYENGCKCNVGWSGEKCSVHHTSNSEVCSGHGQIFVDSLGASKCLCDEGYTGEKCAERLAYSPCQTFDVDEKTGKERRGLKPQWSECFQAGLQGYCAEGRCVPNSGTSCGGIKDCIDKLGYGYFCNYNGSYKPNKCEKVNAETFSYKGADFYYNTDEDLRSWCTTDRYNPVADCVYGFLSYSGAQSWCEGVGGKLVDAEFIKNNCDEFKKHLPRVAEDQQYWVDDKKVIHLGDNCRIQPMTQLGGYSWAAGVVCMKGELTPEVCDEKCIADTRTFLSEMQQVSELLKDFNPGSDLTGDLKELSATLQELKGYADRFTGLASGFPNNPTALAEIMNLKKTYDAKGFEDKLNTLIEKLGG